MPAGPLSTGSTPPAGTGSGRPAAGEPPTVARSTALTGLRAAPVTQAVPRTTAAGTNPREAPAFTLHHAPREAVPDPVGERQVAGADQSPTTPFPLAKPFRDTEAAVAAVETPVVSRAVPAAPTPVHYDGMFADVQRAEMPAGAAGGGADAGGGDAGGGGGGSAGAGGGGGGGVPTGDKELDELARRLYDRLRSRLRQELLVDRERSGLLSDLA